MADVHFFDVRIAKKYGVNCAIILQNIWHWVQKNEANDTNFHDGHYWTYNSTKAFAQLFPYLTQRQIETALKKLRDENIIITGNYNALRYDRTLWYAVTEKGKCILHSCEMDVTQNANGFPADGEPIPYRNTDVTSDDKPYDIIITHLNEKAGTQYRASTPKTKALIRSRLSEGFTVNDFITVIDKKCEEWRGDGKMEKYLRPETLFGTKFEGYLNEKHTKELKSNGNGGNRSADQESPAGRVGTWL